MRTELGQQIRKAFVPQHADHVILCGLLTRSSCASWRRFPRILISSRPLPRCRHPFCYSSHSFDVPIDAVSGDQRRVAKDRKLRYHVRSRAFGLSQGLGIPRAEAQQIIENYFVKYAGSRTTSMRPLPLPRKRICLNVARAQTLFPTINASNRGLRTAAERQPSTCPFRARQRT
ncbi:MAG: hypothetical protein IPM83_15755 [Ignavibacteria bacterium]|nr:hypothetical protein [Ignavibacteria bacterium]